MGLCVEIPITLLCTRVDVVNPPTPAPCSLAQPGPACAKGQTSQLAPPVGQTPQAADLVSLAHFALTESALFPPFPPAPDPRLVSLARISVPHLVSAMAHAVLTPQQGSPPTSALNPLTPPTVSAWLTTFPKEAHVGQHPLRPTLVSA